MLVMLVTSRNEVRVSAVELRWRFIQKAGGPAVSHRTHTNKDGSAAGAPGAPRVTAVMENAGAGMCGFTAESFHNTDCLRASNEVQRIVGLDDWQFLFFYCSLVGLFTIFLSHT